MTNPFGGFTEEALAAYQKALAEREGTDFAEGDSYDFTTCIRPDGSAYGTGGTCRKGSPGEARKEARGEMVKQRHEVSRLKQAREAAAGGEDKKAAAEARRQHIDAKKKLKELQGKHESLREESGDLRRFGTSTNRYKATDDDLKKALDSGKLSANTAEKVRVELAQRKAFGGAKKPEGEFSSFDKLTQEQRDRRVRQQTELVRDLKKDGNADWKSERGRLDRMLDKDKEVAAKSGEQSKVTATPGMAARAKAAKEKLKAEKAANGGKRPDRIQEERRLEQNRKQREMDRKVKANQEKQEKMLSQPAKKPN